MTLKPTNNRILVKPDEIIKQTDFGLVLTEGASEKPTTGIVIMGNSIVNEGQKVLFSKFGYDEVVLNKETLYVISEPNILGIFNE